jgi:hypothetical protein
VKGLSCGVNLDLVKILNPHVYYIKDKGLSTISTPWTKDLLRVLARGRARSKQGGYVDGVFWYTKHVHYSLVWI